MGKILFLDFDGVLHPSNYPQGSKFSRIQLLEEVLSVSFCEIVISSSWRFHYSIVDLKKILGNKIGSLIIGSTGDIFQSKYARYDEITEWIALHKICDWRALDDSKFEFPDNCENLILCDSSKGIESLQITTLQDWLQS
jgi:hypothetical protein